MHFHFSDIEKSNVTDESTKNYSTNPLDSGWQWGYNAAIDFNIDTMSIKNMYNVYSDMKANPSGEIFKNFWRHSFVLHDKTDGLDCVVKFWVLVFEVCGEVFSPIKKKCRLFFVIRTSFVGTKSFYAGSTL